MNFIKFYFKASWLVLFMLLIFSLVLFYSEFKYNNLINNGIKTIGLIKDITYIKERSRNTSYIKEVYDIEIQSQNKKIKLKYSDGQVLTKYNIGDKIDVYYEKNNPENFTLKENTYYKNNFTLFETIIFLIFLGSIMLSLLDYFKQNKDKIEETKNKEIDLLKIKMPFNKKVIKLTFFDKINTLLLGIVNIFLTLIVLGIIFPIIFVIYDMIRKGQVPSDVLIIFYLVIIIYVVLVILLLSKSLVYVYYLFKSQIILEENHIIFKYYSKDNSTFLNTIFYKYNIVTDIFEIENLKTVNYINYLSYKGKYSSKNGAGTLLEFKYKGNNKKVYKLSKKTTHNGQTKIALEYLRSNYGIKVNISSLYRDIENYGNLENKI